MQQRILFPVDSWVIITPKHQGIKKDQFETPNSLVFSWIKTYEDLKYNQHAKKMPGGKLYFG